MGVVDLVRRERKQATGGERVSPASALGRERDTQTRSKAALLTQLQARQKLLARRKSRREGEYHTHG